MKITSHALHISQTMIECGIWHIKRHLMFKFGERTADIDIAPLAWYINTGRAPLDFIRLVLEAKPFMIARKLHEGGSYEEAIQRVKKYLNWDEENVP